MDICDDFMRTPLQPPGLLLADDLMEMDDVASVYSSELLDDGYMSPMYSDPPSSVYTACTGVHLTGGSLAGSIKSEPLSGCYSSDESVDANEYQTINPDDFLHDLFKSEVVQSIQTDDFLSDMFQAEVKQESMHRQTPSPSASQSSSTGSGSSSDYNDFRIEMPAVPMEADVNATIKYALETPPFSPPSPVGSIASSTSATSSHSYLSQQPIMFQPITTIAPTTATHIQFGQAIPLVQGTLIPISATNLMQPVNISQPTTTTTATTTHIPQLPGTMKRIRIQPKPAAMPSTVPATNTTTNTIISSAASISSIGSIRKPAGPPKRIVLSAQDYTALMQKCRTQTGVGVAVKPVTIKAAPAPTAASGNRPVVHQPKQQPLVQSQPQTQQLHYSQQLNGSRPLLLSGQQLQPKVVTIPTTAQVLRLAPATPQQQHTINPQLTPVVVVPVTMAASLPPPPIIRTPAIPVQTSAPITYISTTTSPAAAVVQLPRVAPKTATTPRIEIEDKQLKKHQRMIKNRESACLSRKKKKDYMTALEEQLAQLGDENTELRTQNTFLLDRVQQLERLACACGKTASSTAAAASMRLLQPVQRNKKNAVFLLAVVFMVSLNFAPFGNLLGDSMDTSMQQASSDAVHHNRHLLWVDEEPNNRRNDTPTDLRDSTRVANASKAPLPAFRTTVAPASETSTTTDHPDAVPAYPMCPLHVNQTENVRLASELRRWIGDLPQYLNINTTDVEAARERGIDLNTISNYLLNDDTIRSLFRQLRTTHGDKSSLAAARKKPAVAAATPLDNESSKSALGAVGPLKRHPHFAPASAASPTNGTTDDHNRLQLYDPVNRDALQYAALIEQLRRQDDTFYVVSFSGDHLLLPALAHNKTYRPKMSLMLPSVGLNTTYGSAEFVTLMQIDCEVVNTSIIQIKERLIPRHLRSKATPNTKKPTKSANRTKRRSGSATAASANSGGGIGDAMQIPVLPLMAKAKLPVAFNVSDDVASAYNRNGSSFDALNGTNGGYNLTKSGGTTDEFAYSQYKPYFVDKTRDRREKFEAGP